jgi:hypothetical protein
LSKNKWKILPDANILILIGQMEISCKIVRLHESGTGSIKPLSATVRSKTDKIARDLENHQNMEKFDQKLKSVPKEIPELF